MNLFSHGEAFAEFWRERHLCTLSTVRPDGTVHVVPVGATLDLEAGIARVITSGGSRKARLVEVGPARVALCQVDGRRWSTLEGTAVVRREPEQVADAEQRYTERYKPPRPNPERVVLEIHITRVLGNM
ncbi:PPOX class F420-dependent oxidoreductase [Nonomuraea sp. NPDC000554]|uniref:PPOX class F420-dependent oxidoreductase n=1 Tax=Nonomuraea sp. NPDC000554 TaxID=3154259 RepID=UPI003330D989